MKKQEFLDELKKALWALSEDEQKSSLEYYAEMIDDRMEDGLSEEEAVAAIGTLDEIVEQIMSESPHAPVVVNKEEKQTVQPKQAKEKGRVQPWIIVLLILGAPLWISLVGGLGSGVLGIYVSLWAVVIALYATTFALAVCAIGLLIAAFSLLWIRRFGKGAVLVGGALVCAGLAILFFLLSNLAAKGLVALTKLIWNGVTGIFRRRERTA